MVRECCIARRIDTSLRELRDFFVPFLWDVRRGGLQVRPTLNSGVWKSLFAQRLDRPFSWV